MFGIFFLTSTFFSPVRILKNTMSREYIKMEKAGADKMELEQFTLGSLRKAVFEGDITNGSVMAGQVAGQLKEVKPVAEIMKQMVEDCQSIMQGAAL